MDLSVEVHHWESEPVQEEDTQLQNMKILIGKKYYGIYLKEESIFWIFCVCCLNCKKNQIAFQKKKTEWRINEKENPKL